MKLRLIVLFGCVFVVTSSSHTAFRPTRIGRFAATFVHTPGKGPRYTPGNASPSAIIAAFARTEALAIVTRAEARKIDPVASLMKAARFHALAAKVVNPSNSTLVVVDSTHAALARACYNEAFARSPELLARVKAQAAIRNAAKLENRESRGIENSDRDLLDPKVVSQVPVGFARLNGDHHNATRFYSRGYFIPISVDYSEKNIA